MNEQPEGTGERWAEPGVGADWQHRFFQLLLRYGGKRPAYHIMYIVVFCYVLFYPAIRRRTRYYLARRFPQRRGRLRQFLDSYRLVCAFGKTLIDQGAGAILGPSSVQAVCPDADALAALAAAGAGVVLINAHVGCWQAAMSILDKLNTPVSLVMIPPDPARQRRLTALAEMPFRIIDPRRGLDSVVATVQALQRREIVGLMGDRVFGGESGTVTAEFLGAPVQFPFSPYRLAATTGAPIAVLLTWKSGFATYEIRLAKVIRLPAGLGRDPADYAPWVGEFATALEGFVRDHPWQFFNFYDMWSSGAAPAAPTGENSRDRG